MIAEVCAQPLAKRLTQLLQAFARALAGSIVAQSHKCRVAGIIAISQSVIASVRFPDKTIQQIILIEGVPQPKGPPVKAHEQPQKRIGEAAKFVIVSSGLLCGACVMNVADDCDRNCL